MSDAKKKSRIPLLKSTGVVSALTLLSRVLGLLRDIVFAQWFGASSQADAFFVAFKIPNFLRRLFAEGAFSQAFVPVLSEYKSNKSPDEVRGLIANTAGVLNIILLVVTCLAILGAPALIWLFAPGFSQEPEKMSLAGELLRLTFPYLLCVANLALAAAILNAYGHFAAPAFAPVLLNVVLIASCWSASLWTVPIMALGWGVLLAGLLQWSLQVPFLLARHVWVWPRFNWRHPGVKRIATLMVPVLLGVSVSQVNLLLDTILASFLTSGSVSWLYYADRLMELPLGVFGIAIGTVILPKLSEQYHGEHSQEAFSKTLSWGLRMVLLVGLPAAGALCLLAEPIMVTLFRYREFTEQDVYQAARALQAYSLGVLAFMLVKVLMPGFYARQDTKTPVKIAIKAMLCNIVLNLVLIYPLAHVGLALATSLAAVLNATLLYRTLVKLSIYQPPVGGRMFIMKLVFASAFMLLCLWLCLPLTAEWLGASVWQRCLWLLGMVVMGLGVYVGSLLGFGLRVSVFRS